MACATTALTLSSAKITSGSPTRAIPAKEIHWNLGPPGLDLVWKDTDANGLPLNPTWRGSPGGKSCLTDSGAGCWDAFKICPYHPAPLDVEQSV